MRITSFGLRDLRAPAVAGDRNVEETCAAPLVDTMPPRSTASASWDLSAASGRLKHAAGCQPDAELVTSVRPSALRSRGEDDAVAAAAETDRGAAESSEMVAGPDQIALTLPAAPLSALVLTVS